jgi:hypothetical protein
MWNGLKVCFGYGDLAIALHILQIGNSQKRVADSRFQNGNTFLAIIIPFSTEWQQKGKIEDRR